MSRKRDTRSRNQWRRFCYLWRQVVEWEVGHSPRRARRWWDSWCYLWQAIGWSKQWDEHAWRAGLIRFGGGLPFPACLGERCPKPAWVP